MLRTCLFAVIIAFPVSAAGQDTVDTQLWAQVVATVRLSPDWRLHLEEQLRQFDDVSAPMENIARTAIGRRLSPRATIWGGYAWIAKPPGPGVTDEHRAWEQLSLSPPAVGRWAPAVRIRLEQRWQDGWANNSHRLRVMARGVRPLDTGGTWSLAAWDEVMVNFDETPNGPSQGYDQNRLFAGLLRRLSASAGFEFGYLWVMRDPPAGPRSDAHTAFLWLNLTF